MLDIDTFVTTVYVIVDDFCKQEGIHPIGPGPAAGLSLSELTTLNIIGQWSRWKSQREFYRFAEERLRELFPGLPSRTRYNRLSRAERSVVMQIAVSVGRELAQKDSGIEALDCTAVVVRDHHRRGESWLCGEIGIGHSSRLHWYEGFRLLVAASSSGAITGYGFSSAQENDRQLAEVFLAIRASGGDPIGTIGQSLCGEYVADKGFAGKKWQPRWYQEYGALVIARGQKSVWPKPMRRWLAHHRQIVETVFEKLQNVFGLSRERPHTIDGFQSRLAAKVALHNLCIYINRNAGRPDLATADLLLWR